MSANLKHTYAPAPRTERGKPIHISAGTSKGVRKLVYVCSKTVVIRDLDNPLNSWLYQEHKGDVTCASIAPSGFYICSADNTGKVLVWDCVGSDKVIKLDKDSLSSIVDIAWSDDSKRIAVGGQGREKMGEAFFMDSGASVGEISGHAKPITSISIKQSRPYKLATGSEDFKSNWYPGPPFKFEKSNLDHQRYINCVRFSPDGSKLITVASDKKGFFYDGKTGEKIGELSEEGGHSGSIYSVAWSPDSKRLLTASVDKSCKIWDCEGKPLVSFPLGKDINDQQIACLWHNDSLISVNLSGSIIYLDEHNPENPRKVLLGHNKQITAMTYDKVGQKAYTADFSGYLIEWDPTTGDTKGFTGAPHKTQVNMLHVSNGHLVSISKDDSLKITPLDTRDYPEGVGLGSQPNGLGVHGEFIVVSTIAGVVVLKEGKIIHKQDFAWGPSAIAINHDASEVAVGGKDNKIHVFSFDNGKLTEKHVLEGHRGEITVLEYSPCGTYLGAGDANREIKVWHGKESKVSEWVFHTSRVTCLTWSPDSDHLATGSVDSAIIVWSVKAPANRIHLKLAHVGGVYALSWINHVTLLSAGQDCAMKCWELKF